MRCRYGESLFQVILVETGILGAICLGVCLISPLLSLGRAVTRTGLSEPLAVALCAALIALFIGSFYLSFMVRGLQLIAIAIVGCASAMSHTLKEAKEQ